MVLSMQTAMVNAINEVINTLHSPVPHEDFQWCIMRLEVVSENALGDEAMPLEAADSINQAINTLKRNNEMERDYEPYSASQIHDERRPGRPKFQITEDQLLFFKGTIYYIKFYTRNTCMQQPLATKSMQLYFRNYLNPKLRTRCCRFQYWSEIYSAQYHNKISD